MDRYGIVVAGGGLGGLCAAAGFRKAGIRVVVLERDRTMSSRAQGYRININPVGDAALSQCLPPGHFDLYRDTAHRQLDPAVEVFDTGLALIWTRTAENGDSSLPPSAVDRALLRSILADAAGEVRFGSEVVHADATSDGVVVRLSDRQSLRADLLVAADGVGSALRRTLLPGHDPHPLGFTAIYGRAPLSATASSWLPRGVIDQRFLGMTDRSGTTLALGAWNPRRDPAEAARVHVPDIRLSVSDPYIMWALLGRADGFPSHHAKARGGCTASRWRPFPAGTRWRPSSCATRSLMTPSASRCEPCPPSPSGQPGGSRSSATRSMPCHPPAARARTPRWRTRHR